MQERIMELINELTGDEITADLLRINDLLNNLFLRYLYGFVSHIWLFYLILIFRMAHEKINIFYNVITIMRWQIPKVQILLNLKILNLLIKLLNFNKKTTIQPILYKILFNSTITKFNVYSHVEEIFFVIIRV